MTDPVAIPPVPPRKPSAPTRQASTKTLARQLAIYVKVNDIGKDETVGQLFESLKRSIVAQEVGTSLDL